MREVGTGRLLGTIETIDAMGPGAVVQMFREDSVQVDPLLASPVADASATVPPPSATEVAPAVPERRKRR